jgi:hypothetical protein
MWNQKEYYRFTISSNYLMTHGEWGRRTNEFSEAKSRVASDANV